MLASLIIEEAKLHSDVAVGFYYFKQSGSDRDQFVEMARAILTQLLVQEHQSPEDKQLLLFIKSERRNGELKLSTKSLAEKLLRTALHRKKTAIILDGIDDCDRSTRSEVCSWFKRIIDQLPRTNHDQIRCLFLSQDDGIARKDLSSLPTLSITPDCNRNDIHAFATVVQNQIEERFGPCCVGASSRRIADVVTDLSKGCSLLC